MHSEERFAGRQQRVWDWLQTTEGKIVWITLVGHLLVHVLLLRCMPMSYYTGLNSGHDAGSYYLIAHEPFPEEPTESLMRYKRVAFSLLARLLFPWDVHIGLVVAGVLGAALANLYFYRLASLYLDNPLPLSIVFACTPYLFAAAHVGVPDTLSVGFVLAALYYLLTSRYRWMAGCAAAALVFKEVAAVAVFAMALISLRRIGFWRTAVYFFLAGIPLLLVVIAYTLVWGDILWYLGESRTTPIPAPITLLRLITAPDSTIFVRISVVINLGILGLVAYGLWGLRRIDTTLLIYCAISILPLLFLDWRQYQSDFDMARQYMVAAPVLFPYAGLVNRLHRGVFAVLLAAMTAYAFYYMLSIGTFFVTYKEVFLQLLPL